jgi:hypothetical protein
MGGCGVADDMWANLFLAIEGIVAAAVFACLFTQLQIPVRLIGAFGLVTWYANILNATKRPKRNRKNVNDAERSEV